MGFGGFSRNREREVAYNRRRRGGVRRGYWRSVWRPPHADQNPRGVPILLPGAEYQDPRDSTKTIPYYPFLEHSVMMGGKFLGSFLCSGGFNEFDRGKCAGCFANDQDKPQGVTIKQRTQYGIGIVVLADFHLVPVMDDDTGKPKKYTRGEREGEIIKSKEPCTGRGCDLCNEGHELVFGAKRMLAVGPNHLDNLNTIENRLEQQCACGGVLDITQFMCPSCLTEVIDVEKSNMTNEQLYERVQHPITCPSCGTTSVLTPNYVCDHCDSPAPLGLLPTSGSVPAVVYMNKTGQQTSSALSMVRPQPATEFMVPTDKSPLLRMDEDPDTGQDILVWHKDIRDYIEPYKFDEFLTATDDPQTIAFQVDQIKKAWKDFRNPYMTGDQVRDYGTSGGQEGGAGGRPGYATRR